MALFKDMLKAGESIIRDEIALDYSFIPKLIPFREQQQKYIAGCIKPLFQKRNGKNMLVYGKPGVGKTVACRHIFREIEEESEEVVAVYLNCWQKNTSFKIYLELCEQLGIKFVENKKADELFKMIEKALNRKSVVFAFDEIDKMEDYDFLYLILEEIYRKSILFISNYRDWLDSLDSRIKSRLMADILEFKPYNLKETEGILRQRMEYAFVPGVFEKDAFNAIVKKTFELEDMRSGLHLMKEAALAAENESSKRVTLEHANKAIGKLDEFSIKGSDGLVESEKAILTLIKNNSGGRIGDLFRLYIDNGGDLTYKTFYRKVNKLEAGKFIALERIEGGADGNTTIVSIKNVEKKLSDF